jgi:hypothetical protein
MRMSFRHQPSPWTRSTEVAYINWGALAVAETKRSFWQRVHWERMALLVLNAALWAMIAGLFT